MKLLEETEQELHGEGLSPESRALLRKRRWRLADTARICVANSPALAAPALPIANVPTATPAGICTIDSRLSCPFR